MPQYFSNVFQGVSDSSAFENIVDINILIILHITLRM
jgi:hypothetical protein